MILAATATATTWRPVPWRSPIELPAREGVLVLEQCAVPTAAPARDVAGVSILLAAALADQAGQPQPAGLVAVFGATRDPHRRGVLVAGLLLFGSAAGGAPVLVASLSRADAEGPPAGWPDLLRAPSRDVLGRLRNSAALARAADARQPRPVLEALRLAAERAATTGSPLSSVRR